MFYILGTWYLFQNFPEFYVHFRTFISFPIHWYLFLKPIQNILKIICISKTIRKICFGPGWSTEQSIVAYYMPRRPTEQSTDPLTGIVRVVHASRSTNQSTSSPSGRPIDRPTGLIHVSIGCRSTEQLTDHSEKSFFDRVRSTGRSTVVNS